MFEEKKRYKMYKKGKFWVIAPIVFLNVGIVFYSGKTTVYADEIDTKSPISESMNESDSIKETNTEIIQTNEQKQLNLEQNNLNMPQSFDTTQGNEKATSDLAIQNTDTEQETLAQNNSERLGTFDTKQENAKLSNTEVTQENSQLAVHEKVENNSPIINNGDFEKELNHNDTQVYKANRVTKETGKVFNGKYAMKVGTESPGKESSAYPLWFFNGGKGSVNTVIKNILPNHQYEVSIHYYNDSGVYARLGVLDIEGNSGNTEFELGKPIEEYGKFEPGKLNVADERHVSTSKGWEKHTFTLTTGPRTKEIYAFALTEWTNTPRGAGYFYIDNIEARLLDNNALEETTGSTIEYNKPDLNSFPIIVPVIKEFQSKGEGTFNINKKNQIFYVAPGLEATAKYLGDTLKKHNVISDYSIINQSIEKMNQDFSNTTKSKKSSIYIGNKELTSNISTLSDTQKKEAYEIDINHNKLFIYSPSIEGLQNGMMTTLQALRQRNILPSGKVFDYTDQEIRGLQVDSGRRYYSIDWLKHMVEQMAQVKLNMLQLRLKDNEGIRYDSKVAPQFVDTAGGFWTKDEIDDLIAYAKQFNISIVPEIDLPGHSEQDGLFFGEDWLIKPSSHALDITKKEVRSYMESIYKEAFDMFPSNVIHMGADEYFQTKGFDWEMRTYLAEWAKKITNNSEANEYDAYRYVINEFTKPYLDQGKTVLVWNDNLFDLTKGVVKLDDRIVIDVWAGTIYGSINASNAIKAGHSVIGSPFDLYHDLWPETDKLDRPLPTFLYNEWHSDSYSQGFRSPQQLSESEFNHSKGQFFPIWDDAHGFAPEYILSKTLYPRLLLFANNMWGSKEAAQSQDRLSYKAIERVISKLAEEKYSSIEYTNEDVLNVIAVIEQGMESNNDDVYNKNLDDLKEYIHSITLGVDNTATIHTLISKFENLYYDATPEPDEQKPSIDSNNNGFNPQIDFNTDEQKPQIVINVDKEAMQNKNLTAKPNEVKKILYTPNKKQWSAETVKASSLVSLPQTGEKETTNLTHLGIFAMLSSLLGLLGIKKKKETHSQ